MSSQRWHGLGMIGPSPPRSNQTATAEIHTSPPSRLTWYARPLKLCIQAGTGWLTNCFTVGKARGAWNQHGLHNTQSQTRSVSKDG